MNPLTENLIAKINEKLKLKPLIYFSKDPERALGLEKILENFHIICVDNNYISNQLGSKVFSAEKEGITLEVDSTLNLINNSSVQTRVNEISKGHGFYAQLFQFNNPTAIKIESLGGEVLNNKAELNRQFEDKLSQYNYLKNAQIKIPRSEIYIINEVSYDDLKKFFSNKFVIQLDRAHTGLGTFIIEGPEEFGAVQKDYAGNSVKVSEFIDGENCTLNGCVTKNGIYVAGLQLQITGYPELGSGKGTTVGNDWSYTKKFSTATQQLIKSEAEKVANLLKENNYRGLFGIDVIIRDNEVFVIEINARQTANIPLQTKLELLQNKVPLLLLHLAEFLNIQIDAEPFREIYPLEGAQIFLRAKDNNITIKEQLVSGIYRLQADNSAIDWATLKTRTNVIFLDEEKDKPLIWHGDGYSIEKMDGGFIMLFQNKGSEKEKNDELARMQFNNQIVFNGKVSPWVLEAMKVIENMLL